MTLKKKEEGRYVEKKEERIFFSKREKCHHLSHYTCYVCFENFCVYKKKRINSSRGLAMASHELAGKNKINSKERERAICPAVRPLLVFHNISTALGVFVFVF